MVKDLYEFIQKETGVSVDPERLVTIIKTVTDPLTLKINKLEEESAVADQSFRVQLAIIKGKNINTLKELKGKTESAFSDQEEKKIEILKKIEDLDVKGRKKSRRRKQRALAKEKAKKQKQKDEKEKRRLKGRTR